MLIQGSHRDLRGFLMSFFYRRWIFVIKRFRRFYVASDFRRARWRSFHLCGEMAISSIEDLLHPAYSIQPIYPTAYCPACLLLKGTLLNSHYLQYSEISVRGN